ncbi:MAG TPA: NADH-quinone oxidoreductase subunit M [Alphaproteobacteria bacterium]|nr:NADH-quinone oxidoreductase subunit M [Alphaproteobacteria bacterium]
METAFPVLSTVIFLPSLGAILGFLITSEELVKRMALVTTTLTFLVSLILFFGFDPSTDAMQFFERYAWVPAVGISYEVGIDGISALLITLTTFLMPLTILASWDSVSSRVREFIICMLFLESGMIGVFAAVDLFLFYVFWEATLIPMYFLIGVWGGEQRIYAAIKFILYTMTGSLLMLVAILALYFLYRQATGDATFSLLQLGQLELAPSTQRWLFLAFFLAFAIKVPLVPFHTWLPDAHVEAPTAGSVILAGVLLKMGTYGFVRFCLPLFPQASLDAAWVIALLAVVGIIYGALMALVQTDIKKLVAYSSVSHLGFVMLGIFAFNAQGMDGAVLQMVNHGLSTGALFLLVGMLYDRRHTRLIADYGGIAKVMPVYAACFLVVALSSLGLPGLNGFVGEFLVLIGAFQTMPAYAVLGSVGVVLSAVYLLWMYQRAMFGEVTHAENYRLNDVTPRELAVLVPLILVIVWIGVYPQSLLMRLQASTKSVVERVLTAEKMRTAQTPTAKGSAGLSHVLCDNTGSATLMDIGESPCRAPQSASPETEG